MATAGPNNPATAVNTSKGGGNKVWANPGNVFTSNNVYAVATGVTTGAAGPSDYLDVTNFGFSMPAGATINGITVEYEIKDSVGSMADESVLLIKGGTPGGTDKGNSSDFYGTTDAYKTRGSASDLWGLSWAVSDVNASNFGVRISAQDPLGTGPADVSIDHVRVTITYTSVGDGRQTVMRGVGRGVMRGGR